MAWLPLERSADLHMAQLMPLPLTVSCFSKIQIGFTFLVSAHPSSPGKRAVKRVSVSQFIVCSKRDKNVERPSVCLSVPSIDTRQQLRRQVGLLLSAGNNLPKVAT